MEALGQVPSWWPCPPRFVWVFGQKHFASVFLLPEGPPAPWPLAEGPWVGEASTSPVCDGGQASSDAQARGGKEDPVSVLPGPWAIRSVPVGVVPPPLFYAHFKRQTLTVPQTCHGLLLPLLRFQLHPHPILITDRARLH